MVIGEVPSGMTILPPLLPVTDNDHGAWVVVIATILLILSFWVTIITLISRFRILRKLTWSDACLLAGILFYVSQTVCVNIASKNGLGRHRNTIDEESSRTYSKSLYASQILSIIVLACSKTAVILLLVSIKPFATVLIGCKVVLGFTSTWAVVGVVTLATQCGSEDLWMIYSGQCLNQEVLYMALGVCHILLDVAVVALPVALVWRVQMAGWKRRQISALFALRLFVPATTIAGLLSLKLYFHSIPRDLPWNAVMPSIWLQLTQSASIVCACIPSLKRVLADLQTGMMAGTISESFELSVSGGQRNTDDVSGRRLRSGISPYSVGSEIPSVGGTGDRNHNAPRTESSRTLLGRRDSFVDNREHATMRITQHRRDSQGSLSSHGLVPYNDDEQSPGPDRARTC